MTLAVGPSESAKSVAGAHGSSSQNEHRPSINALALPIFRRSKGVQGVESQFQVKRRRLLFIRFDFHLHPQFCTGRQRIGYFRMGMPVIRFCRNLNL